MICPICKKEMRSYSYQYGHGYTCWKCRIDFDSEILNVKNRPISQDFLLRLAIHQHIKAMRILKRPYMVLV